MEETFTYDELDRLTDVWLNDTPTGHMVYDALGRMTSKRADGEDNDIQLLYYQRESTAW